MLLYVVCHSVVFHSVIFHSAVCHLNVCHSAVFYSAVCHSAMRHSDAHPIGLSVAVEFYSCEGHFGKRHFARCLQ
jgi:hypothetical protein